MDKRALANELWPFMRAKFDPGSGGSAAPIALVTPGSSTASKEFAYSGLGLSNTDDGTTYTLILTSTSNAVAASILASNAAGGLQLARLGVGVADAAGAPLHVLAASGEQLRLSNILGTAYAAHTVSGAGALTIANTGATPANAHLYLTPGGNVGVGMSTAPSAKLEVVSITEQLRTSYSAGVYASQTVSSAGNLTLATTGPNIYTTSHLAHPSYVSQLLNWRISNAGEADFRYIYTDELHAKAFIADLEQALAGGQIVSKSVAKVAEDLTLPAAGGNAYLYVEEFAGFAGFHVFEDGDLIRLRQFDRSGGGLKISDAWGTVVYVGQVISSNPPAQQYLFNRHPTYPGTGSGTIKTGVLAIDYGATGNGYTEQNAIDGLNGVNSPYYQIVTWDTHPKSVVAGQGLKLRVRLGQLRGLTGANQWGLYAGTGWTANPQESNVAQYSVATPANNDQHRYILAGDNGVNIYNADLTIFNGSTPVISLLRASPSIAVGAGSDTMTYSTGPAGYWVGNDSGIYKMRLGSVSGGVLSQGLSWDGSRLNIIGQINVGPNANANYGVSVGNPVIALRFDRDDTGHRGQKNTGSAIDYGPAKFGKRGLLSRRAATNLVSAISNATFDSSSGWFLAQDGTSTFDISTIDSAHTGSAARLVRSGGTYHYINTNYVTASPSANYSVAAWCRQTKGTGNAVLKVWQYNSSSVYLGSGTDITINFTTGLHDWEYKTATFATNAATAKVLILLINTGTGTGGITWWDAVSLAASSVMPGFGEGSAAATSATYASTGLKPEVCTISAWINPASNQLAGGGYLFSTYTTWTSNSIYINQNTGGNIVCAMNNTGVTSAAALPIGVYSLVTCTIDATTISIYINGVLSASGSHGGICTPGATMRVGGWSGGDGYEFDGCIDDFFILDRVLSADEIKALYVSNAPAAINTDPYSLYIYGDNGQGYVRANATGLFGYSAITGAAGTGAFALVTTNGTSFDGQTMDAGDFMLGGVNSGLANLFFDRSLGRLVIRMGSVERIAMNETGAFGIKDSSGVNNVLLFSSTAGNQILQRVDLYSSGSITAGPTFDDMVLDSTGLLLKSVTSFTDLNSIKWKYSSVLTGRITNVVNTGFKSSTTYVSASPVDGTWYSVLSLLAYNTTQINAALTLFSSGSGFYSLALNASAFTSLWGDTNVLSIFGDTPSHGNGVKVIFIANASTVPTTNPTGGGVLYVTAGSLKYRGSSGSITTLGVA